MTIKNTIIRHRYTDAVLYTHDGESSGAAVIAALKSGADLTDAYLRGADLTGADLRGAYLRGADLRGAYLRGADLRGAYLTGADLTGADLTGADLRGAYLRGADLRGAYLTGANLTDANLTGAVGWQLADARDPRALRAAVADHIEAHPGLHDQGEWGDGTDNPSCDTPCCVAGWTCHLGGGDRGLGVSAAATLLLYADGLPMPSFAPTTTREDLLTALRTES